MGWGGNLVGFSQAIDVMNDLKNYVVTDTWIVGTSIEYAAYVEFGTSKMAAQPYLRPAVREVFAQDFARLSAKANDSNELVKLLALEVERKAKQKAPVDTGNLMNSIRAMPL